MIRRLLLALITFLFATIALAAININSATKEELEALNGVGPVKAQAIIDYRKANGPFKSIDDLKKVNGIGDATFDKLKGDISVGGRSAAPAKAAVPAPAAKTEPPKSETAVTKAEPAKSAAPAVKAEPAKAAATASAPAKDVTAKEAKAKDAKVKEDPPKK